MNDARRKAIKAQLESISQAVGNLESLRDEEQEYLDNMPDSLQTSEKAENAQTTIDALSELIDGLEEGVSTVEDAVQS